MITCGVLWSIDFLIILNRFGIDFELKVDRMFVGRTNLTLSRNELIGTRKSLTGRCLVVFWLFRLENEERMNNFRSANDQQKLRFGETSL